jgi:hypothetical protein
LTYDVLAQEAEKISNPLDKAAAVLAIGNSRLATAAQATEAGIYWTAHPPLGEKPGGAGR